MSNFTIPLKILPVVFIAMQLTACTKTVEWEEEVPLNTGELIIVKRTDSFDRRSIPGNPFIMGWWITDRAYRFSWQGKKYTYAVKSAIGPIILWTYPEERTVAFIDSGWPHCSGYAEYRWTKGSWKIQANINPEIIGRPRNIMDYYSAVDGEIPPRVTQDFIEKSGFDAPQNGGSLTHLPASEIASNCTGSNQS